MGEPRESKAEQDIIIQIKERHRDRELHKATGQPEPERNIFDRLGAGFGAASSGGGGYQIEPEALDSLIRKFEDIHDRCAAQYEKLHRAATVATPPSPDEPAVNQARAAAKSLMTAASENAGLAAYAQGLVDALRKANGTYQQNEADTRQVLNATQDGTDELFGKQPGQ